ncbi:MAG: O-antigen ligase family protein [Solirubrobacterales bacterium]
MDLASTIRSSLGTRADDWSFVWPWLLGFGLIVYLGLSGGGFDPLVSGQVGVAIWWILLVGVLVGALPRRRPGTLALCVLALLAGFVLWTAFSLRWTESTEKTAIDLARVATLLGVFALALLSRGRRAAGQMVAAVGAGIVFVTIVALLSRLHPAWFPEASETGRFLHTGKERLSYPLDYWNGLAALIGIGLPLLFQTANGAKSILVRGLAGASLPAMLLALFFTLSRGGIAAALIALSIFLALTLDRIPQFLTIVVSGLGGGILIALATQRDELVHGLTNAAARSQGNELLWITIAVCLGAGLLQAGIARALERGGRPGWTVVSRRQSLIAGGSVLLVIVIALAAVNAPSRVSHAWGDFKRPTGHSEKGTSRLGSVGGENRYQLWSSAVREFDSDPLTGSGSGTFQLWWTRDGDVPEAIVDTHSLYLQTLGELGVVGLSLLVAFLATASWGGVLRVLRAGRSRRPVLAAAFAGSTVLWTTSVFDWMWKIPIVPIATLLLIAVVVTAGDEQTEDRAALRLPLRIGVAAVAVLALIAIAIPLASTALIRQSQADAREGNLTSALAEARTAQNVQPGAASPRIQQALLLESGGDYASAAVAARAATEREPTNWRTWVLLSRIEAQQGRPAAAVRDYRRARSLYPLSSIFAGP